MDESEIADPSENAEIFRTPIEFQEAKPQDGAIIYEIAKQAGFPPRELHLPSDYNDAIERANEETQDIPGMSKSFISYIDGKPVGYVLVHPMVSDDSSRDVFINEIATVPEQRNPRLIIEMFKHLLDQEDKSLTYHYEAYALADTVYKGLQNPGVLKRIAEQGYQVVIDDWDRERIEEGRADKALVMLVPNSEK
ncbi:MAG TPA: hypothetical protein PLD54_01510 [Candidatus Levybacteria bacterium]|nr:hypothetical protein [Candidatus Levybacteria bacterium]